MTPEQKKYLDELNVAILDMRNNCDARAFKRTFTVPFKTSKAVYQAAEKYAELYPFLCGWSSVLESNKEEQLDLTNWVHKMSEVIKKVIEND